MDNIVVYENIDKDILQKRHDDNKPLIFSDCDKILICAAANMGKTNLIKNIIQKNNEIEPYKLIYLMHPDPDNKEYTDMDIIRVSLSDNLIDIFSKSDYRYDKKVFIFDDINYDELTKKERITLNTLLKFISSHCRCDILYVIHRITDIPISLRSRFNNIIMFKTCDAFTSRVLYNSISYLIDRDDIKSIMNTYLKRPYDFILFKLQPINKIFLYNDDNHGVLMIKDEKDR
jgi:hypothetical protein